MSDMRYWPRDLLTEFIEQYKQLPCLWKVKSDEYKNRKMKAAAYDKLVQICKDTYPEANREFVTKKIQSLRGSFRKELRKLERKKRKGYTDAQITEPSLWYYDLMLFTKDQEYGGDDSSDDPLGDEKDNLNMSYDFNGEHYTTADNDSVNISLSNSRDEKYYSHRKKKRHYDIESSHHSSKDRDGDVFDKTKMQTAIREYDAVGINVTAKLKRMDPDQAIYAEMLINKVLGRGLLKSLTHNTDLYERALPTTADYVTVQEIQHDHTLDMHKMIH